MSGMDSRNIHKEEMQHLGVRELLEIRVREV